MKILRKFYKTFKRKFTYRSFWLICEALALSVL
jgi:hypothetical protein